MDRQLLEKFFDGKCSPQELEKVLLWYSSGDAGTMLEEEISASLNEKYPKNLSQNWGKETVLTKLKQQIETEATDQPQNNGNTANIRKLPKTNRYLKIAGVAASLVLMLSIGWWLGTLEHQETKNTAIVEEVFITKETQKGQKLTFLLPDGSQVKLNANSKVWFKKHISSANVREIYLEGEAFFNVAKDSLRPFKIYSEGITTQVLGTSFNVNAYPEKGNVKVAVLTGKVAVRQKGTTENMEILLLPGEKVSCPKIYSKAWEKEKYDYEEEMAWKDGVLYFKNAPKEEVFEKLEKWYGKKIIVENTKITKNLTGTYKDKSLKEVLDGMSYVLGFQYEIDNELVFIK